MDNNLNVKCTGCDISLTIENAGGYRCFCNKCVEVMPEIPKEPSKNGWYLKGYYPEFKWIKA